MIFIRFLTVNPFLRGFLLGRWVGGSDRDGVKNLDWQCRPETALDDRRLSRSVKGFTWALSPRPSLDASSPSSLRTKPLRQGTGDWNEERGTNERKTTPTGGTSRGGPVVAFVGVRGTQSRARGRESRRGVVTSHSPKLGSGLRSSGGVIPSLDGRPFPDESFTLTKPLFPFSNSTHTYTQVVVYLPPRTGVCVWAFLSSIRVSCHGLLTRVLQKISVRHL